MRKWKWEGIPRRVPVAVLASRSHINHRHLALIREQRECEPLLESASVVVPFPETNSESGRGRTDARSGLAAARTA